MTIFRFDDVWGRICEATGWKNQGELASYIGIKQPSVSGAKKRGIFPNDWAIKIALDYNLDIKWLLTGEGTAPHAAPALPPQEGTPGPPGINAEALADVIMLVDEIAGGLPTDQKAEMISKLYIRLHGGKKAAPKGGGGSAGGGGSSPRNQVTINGGTAIGMVGDGNVNDGVIKKG